MPHPRQGPFSRPSEDVPRILPHFDVLWSTSGYEGQSNVILEAMAAGIPVVATDIPGTPRPGGRRRHRLLVPVGDRAAFAADRTLAGRCRAGRPLGRRPRPAVRSKMRVLAWRKYGYASYIGT